MSLGTLISRTRLARGMQQQQLAGAMGVTRATMSLWENGKRTPSADQLRELCRILHVSADVLLERRPFELGPMPEGEPG